VLAETVAEKIVLLEQFDHVLDQLTAAWVHGNLNAPIINPEKGILVVFILFTVYPYDCQDGREDQRKSGSRVVRGGSFDNDAQFVRCVCRNHLAVPHNSLGFRMAVFTILS